MDVSEREREREREEGREGEGEYSAGGKVSGAYTIV